MSIRDARTVEGADEAAQSIRVWFQKLVDGPDAEGELTVTLVQMSKHGESPVTEHIYDFEQKIEEFVAELVESAETDAMSHRPGKIRYAVRVKSKRHAFVLCIPHIDDDDDDIEDIDELPNRKGMITQQMRHNESVLKLALVSAKGNNESLERQVERLEAQVARYERQNLEQLKLVEDLRNMQFARDLEIRKQQENENLKKQVGGMLMKAGPLVAAKLLGGGQAIAQEVSSAPSAIEQMLEGLFSSLEQKPEKLQRIMEVLDPMDIQLLAELHAFVASKREQAAAQQAQQTAQEPETPAQPWTGANGASRPNPNTPSPFGFAGWPSSPSTP